jgi:hypothetical protein
MQIQKWIALNRKKLYRFAFAPTEIRYLLAQTALFSPLID